MDYVKHKMIRKNSLQSRLYQEVIVGRAMNTDLLAVLPTGLGKTPIAMVLSALRLERYPDSKILILAPTKPLIEQHIKTFREVINLPKEDFVLLTGLVKPEEREESYKKHRLVFATPQTVKNDLENKRLELSSFSLVVFDEAHHAIGDYAYPYIAKNYLETGKNPRILGLTASPGGTKEKIREIKKNLGIETVEIRTETDRDVEPYVKKKHIEWVRVELPESFREIKKSLDLAYSDRLKKLKKIGFMKPVRLISKRDLLDLQQRLQKSETMGYRKFWGISLVSQAIKLEHSSGLLETQGIKSLEDYFKKLRSDQTRAAKSLNKDRHVKRAMFLSNGLFEKGSKHPKMGKLFSIIQQQLEAKKDSKIIVFANYRNMVKEIVNSLGNIDRAKPVEFMGQREGLTQKEQKKRIEDFKSGEHNVLVTTSVGEEGIHIAEANLAIFYEPVPSEIRQLQRRGRVGRTKVGKIIILIAKNTRDEAYYWVAHRKEKLMKRTLYEMRGEPVELTKKPRKKQLDLSKFA